MARAPQPKTQVTDAVIAKSFAHTVATGDIVNFRFLFISYSPLRQDSTEDINSPKYDYLLSPDENEPLYRNALDLMRQPEILAHVRAQLDRKGPPQLPWEPLMRLADNAVRLSKLTAAAQAYELLRVRRRIQEEFLAQADAALDAGDLTRGVRGYVMATGLDYDYAAFPEPLPATPNYQERALILHGEYPKNPEDAVALQAPEEHVRTGLHYLLRNAEIAGRLEARPVALRIEFLEHWVRQTDPLWDEFAARYRAACGLAKEYGERLEREQRAEQGQQTLADEVEAARDTRDPRGISAALSGRTSLELEWWQYLKDTAYRHPASALFVTRQIVARDVEIIMPRFRSDSELVRRLGLEPV